MRSVWSGFMFPTGVAAATVNGDDDLLADRHPVSPGVEHAT